MKQQVSQEEVRDEPEQPVHQKGRFLGLRDPRDILDLVVPADAPLVENEHEGPAQLAEAEPTVAFGLSGPFVEAPEVSLRALLSREQQLLHGGDPEAPLDAERLRRAHVVGEVRVAHRLDHQREEDSREDETSAGEFRRDQGHELGNIQGNMRDNGIIWFGEDIIRDGTIFKLSRE